MLEHNLMRASELIQSFKQVAVDRASLQRRHFSLKTVPDEVIMTLLPTVKKTPCHIESEIDPEIDIDGYPGPFGQVLVNLLENALAHGLEGRPAGTVRVSGRRVGDQAELIVADDGYGIPAENLGRVFDPFFTMRMGSGGGGLGLNVVFNIVTSLLGGRIVVESPPGEGARFILILPLQAPFQFPSASTPPVS